MSSPSNPSNRPRVLVVDDEDHTRLPMLRVLERFGFDVTGAATGTEVLEIIARESFHAYVLDLYLPDMSGFDLIPTIIEGNRDAVVFCISGVFTSTEDGLYARAGGAVTLLAKPVEIYSFRQLIAQEIATKLDVSRMFGRGALRLSTNPPQLIVDGKVSEPGPGKMEHKLLVELAKHRGLAVSTQDLTTAVYGKHDPRAERALISLVKATRRRLGTHAKCLATVRGGYKLNLDYGPVYPDMAEMQRKIEAAKRRPSVPGLRMPPEMDGEDGDGDGNCGT